MEDNNSIEVLNLSDNDLTDEHGEVITRFLNKKNEARDLELWEISLRMRLAE